MSSPETRKVHPLLLLLSHTQRLMSMKYSNLKKMNWDDLPKAKSSSNISPNSCQHRNYILLTNCTCHYNHNDPHAKSSMVTMQCADCLYRRLSTAWRKVLVLRAWLAWSRCSYMHVWFIIWGSVADDWLRKEKFRQHGIFKTGRGRTLLNVPKLYWLCLFIHMEYLHTLCRKPI